MTAQVGEAVLQPFLRPRRHPPSYTCSIIDATRAKDNFDEFDRAMNTARCIPPLLCGSCEVPQRGGAQPEDSHAPLHRRRDEPEAIRIGRVRPRPPHCSSRHLLPDRRSTTGQDSFRRRCRAMSDLVRTRERCSGRPVRAGRCRPRTPRREPWLAGSDRRCPAGAVPRVLTRRRRARRSPRGESHVRGHRTGARRPRRGVVDRTGRRCPGAGAGVTAVRARRRRHPDVPVADADGSRRRGAGPSRPHECARRRARVGCLRCRAGARRAAAPHRHHELTVGVRGDAGRVGGARNVPAGHGWDDPYDWRDQPAGTQLPAGCCSDPTYERRSWPCWV